MNDFSERIRRLTPEQRELLMHQASVGPRPSESQRIPRHDSASTAPLSFAQQRLWFLDQMPTLAGAYHIPLVLELRGALDVTALRRSLQAIVDRHDALRASFPAVVGVPQQRIAPQSSGALELVDLSALPPERQQIEIRAALMNELGRQFSLEQGPLYRARLLHLAGDVHVLMLILHHIVADGWSLGILLDELAAFYTAIEFGVQSDLSPLPIRYTDFAFWQQTIWSRGELEHELAYWCERLNGLAPLQLPLDHERPARPTFRGENESLQLPSAFSHRLNDYGRQQQVTLFTALLATFQVLLAQWSGQLDVAVGTPVAGRVRSELEPLVGCFVNTLVLRADLRGNPSCSDFLRRTQEDILSAFAHQELPFEKLVERLRPTRDSARNPLVQILFAMQNVPVIVREMPGLVVKCLEVQVDTSRFDIELNVWETQHGIRLIATYNTDLFQRGTITKLLQHYQLLIEAMMSYSNRRVSELPALNAGNAQPLLQTWQWTTRRAAAEDEAVDDYDGLEKVPSARSNVPSEKDLEQQLAGVWSAMLGVPFVGPNDDFFALGGDSMLAARTVRWLGDRLQLPLDVRALFEHRTPRQFATHVDAIRWTRCHDSNRAAGEELEF